MFEIARREKELCPSRSRTFSFSLCRFGFGVASQENLLNVSTNSFIGALLKSSWYS